jgi:hypothetical protein
MVMDFMADLLLNQKNIYGSSLIILRGAGKEK